MQRSSFASAFDDKECSLVSEEELRTCIDSNFLRKCAYYDLHKNASKIIKEQDYDAVLIDYVEERSKLVKSKTDGKFTLSFKLSDKHFEKRKDLKIYKARSIKRFFGGIKV